MTTLKAARPTTTFLAALLALFVLLIGFAVLDFQPHVSQVSAPFTYSDTDATASTDAVAMAELLNAEAVVMELRAPGEERALARAEAAKMPDGGRLLLSWQPAVAGPMLRGEVRADEEKRLIEALRKHLPDGSLILAMPDTSRRLAALVKAEFPLAAASAPLLLPAAWHGAAQASEAADLMVWTAPSKQSETALSPYLDALLAVDTDGAARLRVLAGNSEAYVLVHLRDAFAMGLIRTDRFAMAQHSFVASEFSHSLASEAKAWGREKGHAAYAIDRDPNGRLRGHFISDARDVSTLLAQLLPFNTTRLGEVPGIRLVWQAGGYWLYRIASLDPS